MQRPVPLKTMCIAAELWDMDVPSDRIGSMLGGLSRSTITGMARRRRDMFRAKQPGIQRGTNYWTHGRIAEVKRLLDEGKKSDQIGALIGRDGAVVRAMMRRNPEVFPPQQPPPRKAAKPIEPRKAKETKVAKAPREKKARPAPTLKAPKPVAAPKPAPIAAKPLPPKEDYWKRLPGSSPVPLMEVRDCRCKWAVEDEDDRFVKAATYFCNEPTTVNSVGKPVSWCATHYPMAIDKGTISERTAHHELARAAR